MSEIPHRPRLARTVAARMHLAGGVEQVVLTDTRTGRVMRIDRASWQALELADGTRDLDALCLALANVGLYRGEEDLLQLLRELASVNVLEDGLPLPLAPPPVERKVTPPDRELELLPGFTLVCDGRGSCCRFYGSVGFAPLESMRARVIAADMHLPITGDAMFTPARGAQKGRDDHAVALVDGCCLFLDGDGRCGLHRRAGAAAKPRACQAYPMTLVDDGEHVRISAGPECACVFASIGRSDGSPLVAPGARTAADLLGFEVMQLPDPVPITRHLSASRAQLRRIGERLCQALETDVDVLALAWSLARALESDGLNAKLEPEPVPVAELGPWIASLLVCARDLGGTHRASRAEGDLSRRTMSWIAAALEAAELPALVSPCHSANERFYLRSLVFGHRVAIEGRPLAHGLRDRATRIAAARAMRLHRIEPVHPSTEEPLAVLEASMRTLGLSVYADELG